MPPQPITRQFGCTTGRALGLTACFLLFFTARTHAAIDLDHSGLGTIWQLVYSASGLDPNADADGDGASNLQESIAGTNPFDSNSVAQIHLVFVSGTNVSVTIGAELGKLYQLQSTPGWEMAAPRSG